MYNMKQPIANFSLSHLYIYSDSKNITLKDMCRRGLIREQDVIVYKRNFSACKVVVSKSMRVRSMQGQKRANWGFYPSCMIVTSFFFSLSIAVLRRWSRLMDPRAYPLSWTMRFLKILRHLQHWKPRYWIAMAKSQRTNDLMVMHSRASD